MRGSEGGIPYTRTARKSLIHARKAAMPYRTLCGGGGSSSYLTHHDPSKVTCWQCIRDLKDSGVLDSVGKVAS